MDKEREIEEMASAISECCEEQIEKNRCASLRCEMCMAEFMNNAGYRKADEVRKETAREILFALLDKKFEMDDKGRVCIVDIYDELNRLFEKYGVEVDE